MDALTPGGEGDAKRMTGTLKRTGLILAAASAAWLWPGAALELRAETPGAVEANAALAGESAGASAPAGPGKVYAGERISRDYQRADLREVIRSIGAVSGKNIVISDGVGGLRVTIKIQDVPWDQALDAVLAAHNLVVEESDNVLVIYDRATFRKIQTDRERLP